MKDIYDILREAKRQSSGQFALATLVRVEGSSYRRPGARMLICDDGRTIGSLSAGCLEEEVACRAHEVLRSDVPVLISFDTRRRFGCAGKIDIFIERISEKFFIDLSEHLEARRSCIAITVFAGPHRGSQVLRFDHEQGQEHELVQQIHPPIRLLIFGDGPDNAPLRSIGYSLGWELIEEVNAATALMGLTAASPPGGGPDEWTAAIVKSHNYGRDFAALEKLLPLNLRYVGLIGPRKRRDQLMNDLLDLEVTINAGFFAPAGLNLGAETPEEIALAVVSEIQRVFSGGSGDSLRESKMSIHESQKTQQLSPNACRISGR
jgi:xanthine dehydrogenase accessory factor